MPGIDSTIIQPLRWYNSTDKQNFRKSWVKNGLRKYQVLINPAHSIIPFQIRRYHSILPVTVLDLYDAENDTLVENILSLLPAPVNNHLKIYSLGTVDNIVFTQTAAFTADLNGGYYYLYLSDGVNDFYSEVFMVSCNFKPQTTEPLIEIGNDYTPEEYLYFDENTLETLDISNLPY